MHCVSCDINCGPVWMTVVKWALESHCSCSQHPLRKELGDVGSPHRLHSRGSPCGDCVYFWQAGDRVSTTRRHPLGQEDSQCDGLPISLSLSISLLHTHTHIPGLKSLSSLRVGQHRPSAIHTYKHTDTLLHTLIHTTTLKSPRSTRVQHHINIYHVRGSFPTPMTASC